MRILINSINFYPELISTGKYTGEMAQWFAEHGHHVRVVTSPPHYPAWEVVDGYSSWGYRKEQWTPAVGVGRLEIFRCPLWVPRLPRGPKRVLYLASFTLTSAPIMMAQTLWKPHLILQIEPTFFGVPQTLLCAWLSRAVSWLHIQDFEVDVAFQLTDFSSSGLRRLAHRVESTWMKKFVRVSTISNRMIEKLHAKGILPSQAVLFPNWVDTVAIHPLPGPSPLRQKLSIATDTIVVLYSGNMGLKQGLHILIEVAKRLLSRPDIYFVICGDGPYREDLMNMAQNLGNIRFLPLQPADALNDLLNLADIHLLPQLPGAADLVMPSKLTGIMASGRPVVATAHPGSQIAATLEGRGVITPSADVDAFAAALTGLASNPALRRNLGEAAREYAVTHLNRDQILLGFEYVIKKLCCTSLNCDENGLDT